MRSRLPGVYCLLAPDDRRYIGQSRDFRNRLVGYPSRQSAGPLLGEAIGQYNFDSFEFVLLEEFPWENRLDLRWIYQREGFWIRQLNPALNMTLFVGNRWINLGQLPVPVDASLMREWQQSRQHREIISLIFDSLWNGKKKTRQGTAELEQLETLQPAIENLERIQAQTSLNLQGEQAIADPNPNQTSTHEVLGGIASIRRFYDRARSYLLVRA